MKTTRQLLSIVSLLIVAALGICHLRAEDKTVAPKKPTKRDPYAFYGRGLDWLQKQQNANGSWGSENQSLLTGYALASYLTQGYDSHQEATVKSAVTWLIELSTKNEGLLCSGNKLTPQGRIEHAICSYVLSEYFDGIKDEQVKSALSSAVQQIVASQNKDGGWQFGAEKSDDDFRLVAWNYIALANVENIELKLPDVQKCLDSALKWFATKEREDGGYKRIEHPNIPSDPWRITGIFIFARLQWGELSRSRCHLSMQWLLNEAKKHPIKYKEAELDLETCFYNTQATLIFGGEAWDWWSKWFWDEIEHAQNEDGSWPVPGGKFPGLQSANTKDGAIYRTAICLKMFPRFGRTIPRKMQRL